MLLQDKDGPKALDEFCRDLCEEVRLNKIDPVSTQLALHWLLAHMQQLLRDPVRTCCIGQR